jgi:hypothetical protein
MNKFLTDKINLLLNIFLCLYIFCGEFIVGITQLGFLKISLAGLSVLFFIFSLLANKLNSFDIRIYLLVIILFMVYIFWWGDNLGNYNLFVTILYGYVLAKNENYTIRFLKIIFFIQLFAVTYEVLTHSFIYKEVSSGILKNNDFNFESAVDLFEDTGFRAKGLFQGTLVATSFIIYFALIFRNNSKFLFLNFIMSLLVNGRLAILVAFLTFILKYVKSLNLSISFKKISNNQIFIALIPVFIVFSIILLYTVIPNQMRENLLSTFDFSSSSNSGRMFRIIQGFSLYFNEYTLYEKFFGKSSYEILDVWNRPVPPEAEFIGMLLDIGLVGLFTYFFFLFKIYNLKKRFILNLNFKELGINYVVIVNIIAILIYRHCLGNLRGAMFWFLVFIAIFQIQRNKKQIIKGE